MVSYYRNIVKSTLSSSLKISHFAPNLADFVQLRGKFGKFSPYRDFSITHLRGYLTFNEFFEIFAIVVWFPFVMVLCPSSIGENFSCSIGNGNMLSYHCKPCFAKFPKFRILHFAKSQCYYRQFAIVRQDKNFAKLAKFKIYLIP